MEKTFKITDIVSTFKKRWLLIVLVTLGATLLSGIITYFVLSPVYQASTQILVNQKNAQDQLDESSLQRNVDLINTYSVIIKSPVILEKVINNLGLSKSAEQLNKNISVTSQENSQVFSLTVEDGDPEKAVNIANAISETFQTEIKNIMKVDNVSILAKAEFKENPIPVKPIPLLNITIAIVIGFMGGVGLSILLEFMDSTLKVDRDVEELLGIPVLGSIPKMSRSESRGIKDSKKQEVGSGTVAS